MTFSFLSVSATTLKSRRFCIISVKILFLELYPLLGVIMHHNLMLPTLSYVSMSSVSVLPVNVCTNIVNVDPRSATVVVESVRNVMMGDCFPFRTNLDLEPTQSCWNVSCRNTLCSWCLVYVR